MGSRIGSGGAFARSAAWIVLGALPALSAGMLAEVSVQDEAGRQDVPAERSLASYRTYLARSPYHQRVFEQFVRAVTLEGALADEVASYRAAYERQPEGATRIVLARLLAVSGETDEALQLLDQEEPQSAESLVLRARVHARLGEAQRAAELLHRAGAESEDTDVVRDARRMESEMHLRTGDLDAARNALHALRDAEPDDVDMRLEVAERFARSLLLEEATLEYEGALAITSAPEERARVLSALAALHEERLEGGAALERSFEALDLLGRGHWLARDLRARVLRLARRAGKLDELIERYEASIAQSGGDLAVREALAEALAADSRFERALEVLEPAVEAKPSDVALGRRRVEIARAADRGDLVVREYQRLLAEHPRDVELAFELGVAFVEAEQLEQARRQWQGLLERSPEARLARRMARVWREHRRDALAEELLLGALELAPSELDTYADLAELMRDAERYLEAQATLLRAESSIAQTATDLRALAKIFEQHQLYDPSRRTYERARTLAPGDATLLVELAQVQVLRGEVASAARVMREAVDLARQPGVRSYAVQRLAQLVMAESAAVGGVELWAARELGPIEARTTAPGPYLVFAAIAEKNAAYARAAQTLEKLLEVRPDDVDARLWAARLLARTRVRADKERAIEHYTRLELLVPTRRREFLEHKFELLHERGATPEVLRILSELRLEVAGDPAGLAAVAEHHAKLALLEDAVELYADLVRLVPGDAHARIRLGELSRGIGQRRDALVQARAAFCLAGPEEVEAAFELLYYLVTSGDSVQSEIEGLLERVRSNPYDMCAPLLAAELLRYEEEPQRALEVLGIALGRSPHEARLLEKRIEILREFGKHEEARRDLETLAKWTDLPSEVAALEFLITNLELEDDAQALRWAHECEGPLVAVRTMNEASRADLACAFLVQVTTGRHAEPLVLMALADACAATDQGELEVATILRYGEQVELSTRLTARLGRVHFKMGLIGSARSYGLELVRKGARPATLKSYFGSIGQPEYYKEVRFDGIIARPVDQAEIENALFTVLREEDAGRAVALSKRIRASSIQSGLHPPTFALHGWQRYLREAELTILSQAPTFLARRLGELERMIYDSPEPGLEVWTEFAWLTVVDRSRPATLRTRVPTLNEGARPVRQLRALQRAVAQHADAPELLSAAGLLFDMLGDYRAALTCYETLGDLMTLPQEAAWLEVAAFVPERARSARFRSMRLQQRRIQVLQGQRGANVLPAPKVALGTAGQRPTSSAAVRRRALRNVLSPREAQRNRVLRLRELGRDEEALALLAEMKSVHGEGIHLYLFMSEGHFLVGQNRAGRAALHAAIEAEAELRRTMDDTLFELQVEPWVREDWQAVVDSCAASEGLVDIYDALRSNGHRGIANSLLSRNGFAREAREFYLERWDVAHAELVALPASEPRRAELFTDVHNLGVKLAEVHRRLGYFERARAIYAQLLELGPEHAQVIDALAMQRESSGGLEEALALHRRALGAKSKCADGPLGPLPSRLLADAGITLPPDLGATRRWSHMRGILLENDPGGLVFNFVSIIHLELELGRPDRAATALELLAEHIGDTPTAFSPGHLARSVLDYELGGELGRVLRTLFRISPVQLRVLTVYTVWLESEGLWEEGLEVLAHTDVDRATSSAFTELVEAKRKVFEEMRAREQAASPDDR
ncbi:MAG: tetratricopeptide repeat protein [bacterium]|nr:tetratricopeptide repeat protein [bacterium]